MKNKIFLISSCLLLTICFVSPVSAIEYGGLGGKPANPNPDNPRTKSIFIFELEPEQNDSDEVLVVNNTPERKNILVYATDSQKSTDGSFACEQFADEKNNVGKWITLETTEVTLEPSTSIKIPFTVNVPKEASVGEENGCIMIQERKESSTDSSGVSLSFRTGLRVVVTIPGEEIRKLNLESFEVKKDDGVIKTDLEIGNSGNVSIDTDVSVRSEYIFGFNHFAINNQYPILRGDKSIYHFEIPKPFWGGIMKVSASAEYDESSESGVGIDSDNPNKVLNFETKYVFVFPKPLALLIELLVLSGVILLIYFGIKARKQRKQISKTWKTLIVKEGDNIQKIAKRYKVSWKKLAKVNNLKAPYLLEEGDKIKVPPVKKDV